MSDWQDNLISAESLYAECFQSRGSDDPRLGDIIIRDSQRARSLAGGDIVLIGFPQDEGVRRNRGRPGAAAGPDAIRKHLTKFVIPPTGSSSSGTAGASIKDVGNVGCDADLERSQVKLGEVVAAVLAAGAFPIILGGGHETVFGHYLGYAQTGRRVCVINFDAHLDVRPLRDGRSHSGSPFRQMIEDSGGTLVHGGYCCIGMQPQSNSAAAVAFMREHACSWIPIDQVSDQSIKDCVDNLMRICSKNDAHLLLTVDLDGIRQSEAPGVSAPSPLGMSVIEMMRWLRTVLGRNVASVDISECNPRFDRDDQTARLAALIADQIIAIRRSDEDK